MSEEAAVLEGIEEDEDLGYVHEALAQYKGARGSTMPILQKVQTHYGYLPRGALLIISKSLRIPLAHLLGVTSFYAQFRLTPRGKYMMKICCGTACHVKGSASLVDLVEEKLEIGHSETTKDKLFTMERVACIGACSLAPVITINDRAIGYIDKKMLDGVIDEHAGEEGEYTDESGES